MVRLNPDAPAPLYMVARPQTRKPVSYDVQNISASCIKLANRNLRRANSPCELIVLAEIAEVNQQRAATARHAGRLPDHPEKATPAAGSLRTRRRASFVTSASA